MLSVLAPSRSSPRRRRRRLRIGGAAGGVGGWLALAAVSALSSGFGYRVAAVPGSLGLGAVGAWSWLTLRRRKADGRAEALESQMADLVDSWALGIRSGLSIRQALELAAHETLQPLSELVDELLAAERVGIPFDLALHRFEETVGTEDARLLVLVIGVHLRSGGNLARALDEVASTIRYRVSSRRELRALTAQGRISGAILGALPLVFFLFLSVTSQPELREVYRSRAGATMVAGGMSLEALAYLWIRRLLTVRM